MRWPVPAITTCCTVTATSSKSPTAPTSSTASVPASFRPTITVYTRSAAYYAQQLYATLAGNRTLEIHSPLPVNLAPDLSATISADGKAITVFAVNDTLNDITRSFDFLDLGVVAQTISVWTLGDLKRAGEPDVVNSFDEPERVTPSRSTLRIHSGQFICHFPRLSLTVLRIRAD